MIASRGTNDQDWSDTIKTIRNVTTRPLKVPLPRGKVLFLSPQKTGGIADRAVDHPPLARLVEAGELEVVSNASHTELQKGSPGAVRASNQDAHPERTMRQRGDR